LNDESLHCPALEAAGICYICAVMRTVTLDILDDRAFNLLKGLEKRRVIRFRETRKKDGVLVKNASFRAVSIDTETFAFDRHEVNER